MSKLISGRSRKTVAVLVSLALILLFAAGGTIAYIVTQTGGITNTFTAATVDNEVTEDEFNGEVKSNVAVKNTGDVTSFVRAQVIITWQNEAGNVYAAAPQKDTDYTISYGTDNGWTLGSDGFWYYSDPVNAEASTKALIEECKWIKDAPETGYTLHVEILSQSVQASPDTAVTSLWTGTSVNGGKLVAPSDSQ